MPDSVLADCRSILAALRQHPDLAAVSPLAAGSSWESATITAIAFGLAPQYYRSLRERPDDVPARALARLAAAYEASAARSRAIFEQFGEIIDALDRSDVRPIALKGLHVAGALRADPALRPMNDLDLLIARSEMPAFRDAMRALGYQERYTSPELGPGVTKHTSTFRRPGDRPVQPNPFVFTGEDRTVEPHVSLEESWFGLRVDVSDGVRRRARSRDLCGHACRVLAGEDLVVHLSVHLCFHLIMGRPSLLQLTDLLAVSHQPDLDWDQVAARAENTGAAVYCLAALRLAGRLLGVAVPGRTLLQLRAASPPRVRERVDGLDLDYVIGRTRLRPLRGALGRIRRGLEDRAETARWARSRREQWRVWRTALDVGKTDTMRIWLGRHDSWRQDDAAAGVRPGRA